MIWILIYITRPNFRLVINYGLRQIAKFLLLNKTVFILFEVVYFVVDDILVTCFWWSIHDNNYDEWLDDDDTDSNDNNVDDDECFVYNRYLSYSLSPH